MASRRLYTQNLLLITTLDAISKYKTVEARSVDTNDIGDGMIGNSFSSNEADRRRSLRSLNS